MIIKKWNKFLSKFVYKIIPSHMWWEYEDKMKKH